MTNRILVIAACWFAFVLSEAGVQAQAGFRVMMHTFQVGSNEVFVTVGDSPSGPKVLVTSPYPIRRFRIPNKEFEKMWKTLMSSEVNKYAGNSNSNRTFNTISYYVFTAGYGGKGTNYVIPTSKASHKIISLAKEFRAFAK